MNFKKRLAALIFGLIFASVGLLAGCAKSPNGPVVGKVNNEAITVKDVNLFADMILLQNGMTRADVTDEATMKSLNQNALDTAVMFKLIMQKGKEKKLYPLSDAASKEVNDTVSQNVSNLPEGMTEEDYRSLETQIKVAQLLSDDINKGIAISDDELKAEYDKQVASQQQSYSQDPAAYESAVSDGTTVIVYKPEGYRYVKHILIAMPQDIADKISGAQASGDTETLKTLRDQGLQAIKQKADEVLTKVQNGEDFDALMKQYGEDPGMQQEPESTTGYELGSASSFVEEFKDAAMKLAKVGDTTGLVATDFGYHIIKWVGNVPSGPVNYDDVKDTLKEQLLQTKQGDAWNAAYGQWKSAAKIEQHPELIPVVLPTAAAATPAVSASPAPAA